MRAHPDPDRPLPHDNPFNVAAHLWLAPRQNPADDPRPERNGELDEAALRRALRALRDVLG